MPPPGMKINPEYKAWMRRSKAASTTYQKARKATSAHIHKSLHTDDEAYISKISVENDARREYEQVTREKPEVFVPKKG